MRSSVVRLAGDDTAIATVVSRASALIPAGRAARHGSERAWVDRVIDLALLRAEIVRRMAAEGRGERSAVTSSAPRQPPLWWTVYIVGVVAGFVGTAVTLPPKGRDTQDPVLMMTIAEPAVVVGAGVLLLLAMLPLPAAVRQSPSMLPAAVLVAVVAVLAGLLMSLRYGAMVEAVGARPVLSWSLSVAALLVASGVLAGRRHATGGKPARPRTRAQDGVREARRRAQRLARELSYTPRRPGELERSWARVLDDLDGSVEPAVVEQARELGPFAYIVWAYYDGDLALPRLRNLRRR
ncbi:hypothetical protein EHW97_08210 [Aeromicrobium camelliae]|uniref:Uncharacterized protein n=1 Tax=Aeromicrobium camelliae TaxID=1538144 RepID=A0A3N6X2Y8_9ACTN|nr:hypothetical protein [Aeromicrobium camelliae]RQN08003.1 hypothetical protein EHW97_08210 [Aeromicrobium camelliae]